MEDNEEITLAYSRFVSGQTDKLELPEKPKIICLCGSTRFKREYEWANKALTLLGIIILSVGMFGHADGDYPNDKTKAMLDELHLRKIDLSDAIVVINRDGYIGESTMREIEYAHRLDKAVYYYYGVDGKGAPIILLNHLKQST